MARIGRYEIRREVGRGGMGIVYEAWDPELRREVAIKQLTAAGEAGRGTLERFRREAQALARVRHANVVAVHEVGEDAGQPFIVMDLVRGESLRDRLGREGPAPAGRAVAIAIALTEALEAVHREGVVHRDLKPENVLMGEDDRILLTDFGLAKDFAGADPSGFSTMMGRFIGTPGFAAPEQARGEHDRVGPATDV